MQTYLKQARGLLEQIRAATRQLKLHDDEARLVELEKIMRRPDFWDEPARAAKVSQEASGLKNHVDFWQKLEQEVAHLVEICELGDASLEAEAKQDLAELTKRFGDRQFELMLSGPYDRSSAILSIYAGTGGTDAQDWAEMLLRMYLRYAEKEGFKADVVEQSDGEEAGIKSVTVEINGPFAFGRLKSEKGVHRLVRLSPFNSDNLRQTSFAMVEVIPQLDQPDEVGIDPADLRVDVFRSGGHGGQSVNTTDSAVRLTHIPTGIVVAIQNERSQLQNKEKAMAILKSRLVQLMHDQHKAEISELKGSPQSAEWGNQIRSYVLHPYTKVKDHRTNAETSQAQSVLDGDIELFIEAYLKSQIGQSANSS